jgi:hypothetical protein
MVEIFVSTVRVFAIRSLCGVSVGGGGTKRGVRSLNFGRSSDHEPREHGGRGRCHVIVARDIGANGNL